MGKYKVDNAIIMAAGKSSRFAPLSYEKPKSLIEVRGEILIERQIAQIKSSGIDNIYIVVGYKADQFNYLEKKMGIKIIENPHYDVRNNNSSIFAAKDIIRNSYICSGDNYFLINPFEREVSDSYYASLYSRGYTKEWCIKEDDEGYISDIAIGGAESWYMIGHTFWSEPFSTEFISILERIYEKAETKNMLWEEIYMLNLDKLKMKIRKYKDNEIYEFDSLDELRQFDTTYKNNTKSRIIKEIADSLGVDEFELKEFKPIKKENSDETIGFSFTCNGTVYKYNYKKID